MPTASLIACETPPKDIFSPRVGHVTISIEFSEVMTGDSSCGAIERADKALYHAKSHGRNQVRSFAAMVAAPTGEVELF